MATAHKLIFSVLITLLIMNLTRAADFYYPQVFNPALGKPVTLSPAGATCGENAVEEICESRTNTVDECETRPQNCDLSCPYTSSPPAMKPVFDSIQQWETNCVVKDTDTSKFAPSLTASTGYLVDFGRTVGGGDACYLVMKNADVVPISLSGDYWSISLTLWIKPAQVPAGTFGTIVDIADSEYSSVLQVYISDNQLHIRSLKDIHPTSWKLEPDKWQHIAIQIHRTQATYFKNGAFRWPAMYVNDTFRNPVARHARVGDSFQGGQVFRGYMQDFRLYYDSLTNREVREVYEGSLSPVSPQSECRCPSQAPLIETDDMTYCTPNPGSHRPQLVKYRLNTDAHLPEFVVDGKTDTKWISSLGLDEAEISIDLMDDFEIRKVKVHFYSPYPNAVIISRRYNATAPWEYWQLFSHDCLEHTGFSQDQTLNNAEDYNCKPYIQEGEQMPYSQGVLTFDLLAGRPGQSGDGGMSLRLREFMRAWAVKVRMKGHPYKKNDRQMYHSLIEVELEGYCNCHGHGTECILSPGERPAYNCVCAADSYTKGRQCDQCVEGTYRDPSKHAYDPGLCQPCACSEIGSEGTDPCDTDGGQCRCKEHVTGRACDECQDGYFRLVPDNSQGCSICTCHTPGTIAGSNTCHKTSGRCPCKRNVEGESCRDCKATYFGLQASNPEGCEACNCVTAGTSSRSRQCDAASGQCRCKANVAGRRCDECNDGFYNLKDSSAVGCQACNCDSQGAVNNTCHPSTGQCYCKSNVVGQKCNQCAPGKYALTPNDLTQNGCTNDCACDGTGSQGSSCEKIGGQCPCKANTEGRTCDRCDQLAYGFGQSQANGCLSCNCDRDGTFDPSLTCNVTTGQCPCKTNVRTPTCGACEPGTYGLRLFPDGCRACDCYAPGTKEETTCNPGDGQCVCKPGEGDVKMAGRRCNAYIGSMVPEKGPVAGGTDIVIKGGFFGDVRNASVIIGDTLPCTIDHTNSDPTMIQCSTATLNPAASRLEQKLEMVVKLADKQELYLRNASFTYKPDPVIWEVSPRRTILSGGLPLTVSGEHLDSVHSPYLLVYVAWRDVNGTAQLEILSNLCMEIQPAVMVCGTPEITIVAGPGVNDVQYYIGFRLDGVTDYLNLNKTLPEYGTIAVYNDPEIEAFIEETQAFRTYWPYKHTHLNIKGDKLNHGALTEDYAVIIGDSMCEDVDVTEKDIVCIPPAQQPASLMDKDHPEVMVTVGNKRVFVGYLRYEKSFWDNDPFRYGVFGGIGGALLVIVLIVLCCCCGWCRRGRGPRGGPKTNKRGGGGLETGILTSSSKGSNDYTTEDKGYSNASIATYLDPAVELSLLELMPTKLKEAIGDRLIERKHVTLGTIIGQGQYGQVYLGRLLDRSSTQQMPVAIKTTREDASTKQEAIEFLQEATIMKDFKHENIMSLVGVVLEKERALVLLPFMENGDLRTFISNDGNMLTVGELINFGQQVCSGMCYLSERHFIHRDLACRNCMINKDLLVKIGDFGLSRDIYEDDYYEVGDTRRKLPIKWMAPESLERGTFSTKTDVWSFGVLQWELLTRGCNPYPDVDAFDVKFYLRQGNRMDRPDFAPEEMYQLILMCWDVEPRSRPTFYEIQQQIAAFLEMQNARTNLRKRQRQQVPTQRGNSYIMPADD